MAHIINKQRYEKKAIYEKKLLTHHKAITINPPILHARTGINGCYSLLPQRHSTPLFTFKIAPLASIFIP